MTRIGRIAKLVRPIVGATATTFKGESWEQRFLNRWEVAVTPDGRVVVHRVRMERAVEGNAVSPEPAS